MAAPDPEDLPKPLYTKAQVDALLTSSPVTGGLGLALQSGVLVVTDGQGTQWRLQQLVPNS